MPSGEDQIIDAAGDRDQRGDDRHLRRKHGQVREHAEGGRRDVLRVQCPQRREGRLCRGRPPPATELCSTGAAATAAGPRSLRRV